MNRQRKEREIASDAEKKKKNRRYFKWKSTGKKNRKTKTHMQKNGVKWNRKMQKSNRRKVQSNIQKYSECEKMSISKK